MTIESARALLEQGARATASKAESDVPFTPVNALRLSMAGLVATQSAQKALDRTEQIHLWNKEILKLEIPAVTRKLIAAKKAKKLSFADLEKVVERDEVWVAAVFYRQASASLEEATELVTTLGLNTDIAEILTDLPIKGLGPVVPTDPLIYRFYEIMQVYGMPLKHVIHEKFGDGIMSAIDFTVDVEKEEDPVGDRVKITMSGKFLPYKKW